MIKYLLSMFIYEGDPRNVINLRFHCLEYLLAFLLPVLEFGNIFKLPLSSFVN